MGKQSASNNNENKMRDFSNIYNEYTDNELIDMYNDYYEPLYAYNEDGEEFYVGDIIEPIVSEYNDDVYNCGTLTDLDILLNE